MLGKHLVKLLGKPNSCHGFKSISPSSLRLISTFGERQSPVNHDGHNRMARQSTGGEKFFQRLIPVSHYMERQQKLVNLIDDYLDYDKSLNKECGSVIVVSGANRIYVADTRIPTIHFKQNSDFLYLTGLNTKEAAHCALVIIADGKNFKSHLFVPFTTAEHKIWEGDGLLGPHYRDHLSCVATEHNDFVKLSEFLKEHTKRNIFLSKAGLDLRPPSISGHAETKSIVKEDPFRGLKVINVSHLIDRLKVIKSPSEISAMQRTCEIGALAMNSTRDWSQNQVNVNRKNFNFSGVMENQIAAHFDYTSRTNGACKPSYPPVVAGDDRATIIHYGATDKPVNFNEWILMDAGCEDIEGYCSDITRSWPIFGEVPSSKGKLSQELYEALSDTQSTLISFAEKNLHEISLNDLFHAMCHYLSQVIAEFGLAPKGDDAIKLADHFCPHHVSHYLGLDVHDTPTIDRKVKLVNGMCFTIEPGLYFRHDDPKAKKEFQGIGLRVEDNFAINHDGKLINLTKSCPHILHP